MIRPPQSTRDVIIRTEGYPEALDFYGKVLGLPMATRSVWSSTSGAGNSEVAGFL